jgi:PIN domain nuclease of toxin-antitoxin system
MTIRVLDSSALIALILDEPGAETVARYANGSPMSIINFAETIGYFARRGLTESAIRELVAPFGIEVVPLTDTALAYEIGLLDPMTRPAGLSLADRCCLALAKRLRRPALTADRAWTKIAAALGVEVELIR